MHLKTQFYNLKKLNSIIKNKQGKCHIREGLFKQIKLNNKIKARFFSLLLSFVHLLLLLVSLLIRPLAVVLSRL